MIRHAKNGRCFWWCHWCGRVIGEVLPTGLMVDHGNVRVHLRPGAGGSIRRVCTHCTYREDGGWNELSAEALAEAQAKLGPQPVPAG